MARNARKTLDYLLNGAAMKRLICLLFLVTAGGCGAPVQHPEIRSVLDRQAEAWIRGDIESFMQGYWQSDELVFASPKNEIKGWQTTLDRYRKSYPTREAMGELRFEEIEVAKTGEADAAVSGQFVITRTNGEKKTGRFFLALRQINGAWVIVRDYTVGD